MFVLNYTEIKIDKKAVIAAIKAIRGRKRLKENNKKRFQAYKLIAKKRNITKRVKYPNWVTKMVRDEFPDSNNQYSS